MALPGRRSAEQDLRALFHDAALTGRFITDLFFHLRHSARGALYVWRLSLTMPAWEPDRNRLFHAMSSLANAIAEEPDGGAWLALDITKEGREHVYGIALSSRPRDSFVTAWAHLTGATASGCQVRPVTGQLYGWGGDSKQTRWFETNLARVVRYGVKTLPWVDDLPLAQRVVASGKLGEIWQPLVTQPEPQPGEPGTPPGLASVQASSGVRHCQRCRKGLDKGKRKHALWCSASCRTMAWMERQALRQQLTAEELDAFEERAAILEWDARLHRAQAEQQAFDSVRQSRFPSKAVPPAVSTTYSLPN